MADTPLVEMEILYQGLRISSAGSRYIVVSPLANPLLISVFTIDKEKDWKPWSHITPGSVVISKVRTDPQEKIESLMMRGTWVRQWENKVDRLRWSAEHESAEVEWGRKKLGEKQVSELHAKLDPIRWEYQRAVGWRRSALLAEIIRFLHS